MEKIASFTVNHLSLLRGIYVSRKDKTKKGETITTFDIRMKEPNRQKPMDGPSLHTIEHLGATYLRNRADWSERILYLGPMGCRTGCYLLVDGDFEPEDIIGLMRDTFSFIAGFRGEIPGATARDCGDCTFHDLEEARKEAKLFLDQVLNDLKEENMTYPE